MGVWAMKVAGWIERGITQTDSFLENASEVGERSKFKQQKLLLMDLCIFPEAFLEIPLEKEAAIRIMIAKLASELSKAEQRGDVTVDERRAMYALQIATYIAR